MFTRRKLVLLSTAIATVALLTVAQRTHAQSNQPAAPITEKKFPAPHDLTITVRMVGPVTAQTDLQIICAFKHNPAGDKYIEAFKDFDDRLQGLLSALRNRGEFVGELGETMLFNAWPGSIAPKRVLVIGLGPEKDLSLDTLRLVGRVALREAVRLHAADVAFAPVIRDQGNETIDVGDGDRALVEQLVLAYDTEKRLQAQTLADGFSIHEWVIEAGPAYFSDATAKVAKGLDAAAAAIHSRAQEPYRKNVN